MTLGVRKLIVIGVIVEVFLLANAFGLARLLASWGLVDVAQHVRSEYLTDTALAVIAAMLFLFVSPSRTQTARRCRVCDEVITRQGKYCSACGSRV